MILAVHSVSANEHDSRGIKPLISKVDINPEKYSNKGYQVPANVSYFHTRGIKARIQKKAYRNRLLSRIAILFNKLVSKNRWGVECTFGSIKSWSVSGKTHYKGLDRVHAEYFMEAMAHNLYRALGTIMNCP
ncbi:MAG: transposase [Flavobacteriales bacterium Tduv]